MSQILDFVHYRIGTLWTNQKQCAIVHLENIVSTYWIISSWVSTSHIGSEVCVPTREKNMRLVCCLIWLLPKALAAAMEKIRILKSGAWTLFWLKNALELEIFKKPWIQSAIYPQTTVLQNLYWCKMAPKLSFYIQGRMLKNPFEHN